jgi:RNA polymerase sigma-70 factor (ECF subfamily)
MVGDSAQALAAVVQSDVPTDHEEERQIDRARRGEAAAIDWLLMRYRQRVVRLATHILRRPGEAEDVAQEAFVRAFRSLRTYRAEGRFYTWLYQIVVHICLDRRKLARWDRELPLETLPSLSVEPEPPLDALESRILVETLLDQLTPPMRAILVLRELEGLEYQEIAEVLHIPVGRVRWRLHAARAQFQTLWLQAAKETNHV